MKAQFAVPFLVFAACSQAATITYNQTVTLDASNLSNNGTSMTYLQNLSGNPQFQVQAGDTVTGTITFSVPVTIQNPANTFPNWILLDFFPQGYAGTVFTETVQVLGVSGTLGASNPYTRSLSGNSVLLAGLLSVPQAMNFSFTGFTYTINVAHVTDTGNNEISAPFSFSRLDFAAQTISVATPEPANMPTSGLALALFLVAPWVRRRCRASTAGT